MRQITVVDLEARVRPDHPLRAIRQFTDVALESLTGEFSRLYSGMGRPSIPPEMLLRAMLLQAFYSIRSERQLMERLEFDLLFRWFVGLGIDAPAWDHSTFSKNRDRLLEGEIAARFLAAVLAQPRVKRLLSTDHFSVDGTLIEAWASMKSFKPKAQEGGDPTDSSRYNWSAIIFKNETLFIRALAVAAYDRQSCGQLIFVRPTKLFLAGRFAASGWHRLAAPFRWLTMALKDLLVYVDRTQDALMRMRLAADIAARHGSKVTALFVQEWTDAQYAERRTAELGLVSGAEVERLDRRIDASNDGVADRLRSALDVLAIIPATSIDWRVTEGPASVAVAQHARYADLCIVGHYGAEDADPNGYSFSEQLLFSSGRPVLSVPADRAFQSLGRHVAVAWNSSRPSARAVNDAMPLLELAEHVSVLTVNAQDFIGVHGALPAQQLVEHLKRHGIEPELVELDDVPAAAIADTLQSKSGSLGADLLVAGAFGHPRLWEKFLGGTTRSLLDHMSLPIMMSN